MSANKNFNVSSEVSNEMPDVKFKNDSIPAKKQKLATSGGLSVVSTIFKKK